ncbi:LysM peptidoglycan-binding domain-containing protein [Maribacter algarum]|uniref:LysM peptidoglycan-binding domain-containing protein n=1 Tax=Maribacter algarum (ex Zhang et al. 2020) TaxID=2578118 RepID=A0A5S3PPE8_9FLAO|nr:LysM peptidoglycan-binding domain-containing protein [Maribacter algarum]TMM56334.1 LysM peptidoglycan-binding domain-containing protein [Maribacter algarum]
MNQVYKNIVVLLLFVFVGCKATAQKFLTHPVKKGETLESVAKKYKVTPANILKYNKEIRAGQDLRPSTILVIPAEGTVDQAAASTPTNPRTPAAKDPKAEQEEPIGFTSHKVRKRETLYGIAQRYNITEEDIKRYNRDLYSTQLKKKMVLKIPKYRRVKPSENTIEEGDYETYTVAAKETRWSIAHKYGITIDSMETLNPSLAKNTSYLAEGAELKMPKKAGSSVQNQVTELFLSYSVPAKMNFYQLEKKFNVKSDEIVRLNPEISERGGLKEGMVIRIPERKVETGEVNTDNYIFYEVKPKQTEFSLTRKLGISYTELLALNPDLKNGLKAGMVLKLPKEQTGDFEVRNALVLDKINLLDSINVANTPKLMFMLPFRTDRMDADNRANTVSMIQKRRDANISLGLYSGALIALDSLAELGISVDVKSLDNQLSPLKTKSILISEDLSKYSAVIGPLDVPSLQEVAVRASQHRVPVIAPIPADTKLSMSNVFFSYTSDKILRKRMLAHLKSIVKEENILIIADSTNAVVRDSILAHFPEAKVVEVIEEEKNIGIDREKVAELLSEEQENWVIVETDNFRLASSVTSILNSFHNSVIDPEISTKKVFVRMFTTYKGKAFENEVLSNSHLSNLNFTYPSVYREVGNNAFVKRYRKRFGETPDMYAVRGFDLTYDLVLKLAYKNNLMEVSKVIGETEYTGNKFSYEKDFASGYYNQASYIMSYEKMRIKQVN